MDRLINKLNRLAFFCMAFVFITIFTWQATPTFIDEIKPVLPLLGLAYALLGLAYIFIAMILWTAWITTLLLHLRSRLKFEQHEREVRLKQHQSRFPSPRDTSASDPGLRVPRRRRKI